MSNYESKAQAFLFAIIDAYKNDDLNLKEDIPKIEVPKNGDYTEDLQALIIAQPEATAEVLRQERSSYSNGSTPLDTLYSLIRRITSSA